MQPYDYTGGHPPRQAVQAYTQKSPNLRTLGRRKLPEQSYFKSGHVVLNITEVDPQLWDNYIEQWTVAVIRDYDRHREDVMDGWQMIRIGENYLGETARAIWEDFKVKFPQELQRMADAGDNIRNYCYTIHRILTGKDANEMLNIRQQEAMRNLERLQLLDWNDIKPFCNDFLYYTSISGNYFTAELGDKFFSKLPDDLGKEIRESWKKLVVPPLYDNIGVRVQHVFAKLKETQREMYISREIMGLKQVMLNV